MKKFSFLKQASGEHIDLIMFALVLIAGIYDLVIEAIPGAIIFVAVYLLNFNIRFSKLKKTINENVTDPEKRNKLNLPPL